jgi:hypothetical protein
MESLPLFLLASFFLRDGKCFSAASVNPYSTFSDRLKDAAKRIEHHGNIIKLAWPISTPFSCRGDRKT